MPDSLNTSQRHPKVGDRKVCSHICFLNNALLFSYDYFLEKIMKGNVEICNEKNQGRNLKNKETIMTTTTKLDQIVNWYHLSWKPV